ncbi:hypothetical protein [uncultured Chitinophaga sp.]|jgi:hypothetical protein|uniref:hypothetical protein n=1 Tax=uncultured Chitinophaga sp. TaxID=339340 RepID=UPI0026097837|nr:hypothetical protein [uncultured Chitinophaga sp.]
MNEHIRLKHVILLLILLLPVPSCCEGQALWGKTPSERSLMKHLREIASYVRHLREDREDALSTSVREQLDTINYQVNDILNTLPGRFQAAWQSTPPDGSEDYRRTISNYEQILLWFDTAMQVKNAPEDIPLFGKIADTLGKTLAFIREDVRLQYVACGLGKERIHVDVKVRDATGREQPGYQVFVKPYISSHPSLVTMLNSVPTGIPSGWKLCWLIKDERLLQQQEWRVKGNDTSTHHLVFILK